MMGKQKAFTIVELLIVIVVIAILAAIVIVAYNGISKQALVATIKSDLTNASKQMELLNVDGGSYPTTLPSGVKPSSNVALSLSQVSNGYCINGESLTDPNVRWYYDSAAGKLQEGNCSGAVLAGSESGTNPNLITNTNFSSGWSLSLQNATAGRTIAPRPGAAGDPYPNRPVLVLTNSSTAPTTWAVIQGSSLDRAAIVSGSTYMRSFYVRKTGPYNTWIGAPGVLDGNGLNVTLPQTSTTITPTNDWQKISVSSVAQQNAPSSNFLYIGVPTAPFTTSGWTLEFQDFQLRQQ